MRGKTFRPLDWSRRGDFRCCVVRHRAHLDTRTKYQPEGLAEGSRGSSPRDPRIPRLFGTHPGGVPELAMPEMAAVSRCSLRHKLHLLVAHGHREGATLDSTSTDLARLQRRKILVELLLLGFAILAFGWTGAALVLIVGDAELRRDMLRVFSYLWVWLAAVPLCGFVVCWCWRWLLQRKIGR